MSIQELIKKTQEAARQRTPEQHLAFLQRGNILDANGHYKAEFFSAETVERSKTRVNKNN